MSASLRAIVSTSMFDRHTALVGRTAVVLKSRSATATFIGHGVVLSADCAACHLTMAVCAQMLCSVLVPVTPSAATAYQDSDLGIPARRHLSLLSVC